MAGRRLPIQLLPWLLLLLSRCLSATYLKTTRLGVVRREMEEINGEVPPDFTEYFYTQTLDHFNYRPDSYITFQQRYIMNTKYWGGANTSSPILVYTGDEASVTDVAAGAGFITYIASHFNALLVFIEHRYYGASMPFGGEDEAFRNTSTLGYFSSTQALADYAELITYLKTNLSAHSCPVIAIGGSYGGMLASWFRLKYPHVAIGALASSAPILYFDDITPENGYHVVVTKDFREASESCYNTIIQSWVEIDKVASEPDGLTVLSQKFKTCEPLNSSKELKHFLEIVYVVSAQYDNHPDYPVNKMCDAIDGANEGSDIFSRIVAGVNASLFGLGNCTHVFEPKPNNRSGWEWQICSEMVMPIGYGANETMFQASPFDLDNYTKDCQDLFGVTPRPHWITIEFGGHDIKSVLGNFASNIIFSNGLRDPYSAGGVLQNISDSVVAIYTTQGAHCLDLLTPAPTNPEWLVAQQSAEIKIIEGWIAEYNARPITDTNNGRNT